MFFYNSIGQTTLAFKQASLKQRGESELRVSPKAYPLFFLFFLFLVVTKWKPEWVGIIKSNLLVKITLVNNDINSVFCYIKPSQSIKEWKVLFRTLYFSIKKK